MVSLVDLLSNTYGPVQMMMLPYLDVADVIALTRSCKGFGQLQDVLQTTAYNVDRLLQHFFSDPVAFRSLQGRCGALLFGRPVRQFLQRSAFTKLSILLFVTKILAAPMISYLQLDGYVKQDEQPHNIHRFAKYIANGQKVELGLFADDIAALAQALRRIPATAGMNFLAWNKAYAVFPYTTFIRSESYLLQDIEDIDAGVLRILAQDGLSTMSVSWAQREVSDVYLVFMSQDKYATDIGELVRRRRIGDKHTWIMNLRVDNVSVPNLPTAVLESATFRLRIPPRSAELRTVAHYEIVYDCSLQHPVLRHQYVVLKENPCHEYEQIARGHQHKLEVSYYSQKCRELSARLDELTLIELMKMSTQERPSQYAEVAGDLSKAATTRNKFKLPATWTFHDDQAIAYLEKAWEIQQKIDQAEETSRKALFDRSVLNASAK